MRRYKTEINPINVTLFTKQFDLVLKKVLWDSISKDLMRLDDNYEKIWKSGIAYELKFLRDFLGGSLL